MKVTLTVNGSEHQLDVAENTLLVDLIREELRLTGTHVKQQRTVAPALVHSHELLRAKPARTKRVAAARLDEFTRQIPSHSSPPGRCRWRKLPCSRRASQGVGIG